MFNLLKLAVSAAIFAFALTLFTVVLAISLLQDDFCDIPPSHRSLSAR